MKIAFLLPVVSQARFHKRVAALERLGVQSEILAFERDYYPGKPWSGGYKSLGRLQHKRYHKRLVPLVKAIPTVRAAVREADVIYAFGLDTLLLGWLASRALDKQPKIVYECGDPRMLPGDSLLSRGLRWLEHYLLRRVNLLVVPSKVFLEEYYQAIQGIQGLTHLRYQVIEHKLDANTISQPQNLIAHNEWDGVLRIGYFGVIRCRRSWEILKKAAKRGEGQVQVYVRGIPMGLEGFEEETRTIPHIDYGGPYVSPDELPAMYGQVDMVWIATYFKYNWAYVNRFYESCFFQRPMLAQLGAPDGRVVESLGLGVCVDLLDAEKTVNHILGISKMELAQWQKNITRLPKDIYVYTDEHERLIEAIQ